MVILFMDLEMFGQVADTVGQKAYLYLRGSGITVMGSILIDQFFFIFCCQYHFL